MNTHADHCNYSCTLNANHSYAPKCNDSCMDKSLADRIKKIRMDAGDSPQFAADKVGVSRQGARLQADRLARLQWHQDAP